MSYTDKIEIYASDGQWRWRYVAPNGRILSQSSEGYRARTDAIDCALRTCGLPPLYHLRRGRSEGMRVRIEHSLTDGKIVTHWRGRKLTYAQFERPGDRILELVER